MKTEVRLFGILFIFFIVIAPIYGTVTHWQELTGPIALFLTSMLVALVTFYLWQTGRKLPDRPEDNPNAEQSEAEGDYGNFSPHSWWPLAVGFSATLTFAGLAIGWWLFIIGTMFAVLSIIGWVFEYYHGEYAQ